MKDMLRYLIARDTMHQQQWLAADEDVSDTNQSAPNDVPDEGDYRQYAYSFFHQGDEPLDLDARWTSGSSLEARETSPWPTRLPRWARSRSSWAAPTASTPAWKPPGRATATAA
jgi:Mn-containing catalase